MGLQGIFDPMVRAYFKNLYGGGDNPGGGGGGGTPSTGVAGIVLDPSKEYDTNNPFGAYQILDVAIPAADVANGIYVYVVPDGTLSERLIVTLSAIPDPNFPMTNFEFGELVLLFVHETVSAEGMTLPAGVYATQIPTDKTHIVWERG